MTVERKCDYHSLKKNVKKRIVWRLKENDGQIGMEGQEKK